MPSQSHTQSLAQSHNHLGSQAPCHQLPGHLWELEVNPELGARKTGENTGEQMKIRGTRKDKQGVRNGGAGGHKGGGEHRKQVP